MIAQKIEREENNVTSFASHISSSITLYILVATKNDSLIVTSVENLGSLTEHLNMELGYWIGKSIHNKNTWLLSC